MSKAVVPVEKKRLAVYNKMPPALQRVADEMLEKVGKVSQAAVMVAYNVGKKIAEITENEAEYGQQPIQQLAVYLAIPAGAPALYAYRQVAVAFDRDFVKDKSSQPMANGSFLTTTHWIQLAKLADRKDQDRFLQMCFDKSLGSRELEAEIRAHGAAKKNHPRKGGGRKPATPTSTIAGLQTLAMASKKFINLGPVVEESVFGSLDGIDSDGVDDTLLRKLIDAQHEVNELLHVGAELATRLGENVDRVKGLLKDREEGEPSDVEAGGKGEAEAEARGKSRAKKKEKAVEKGVKHAAKRPENGKKAKGGEKAAKKPRRPEPTTV